MRHIIGIRLLALAALVASCAPGTSVGPPAGPVPSSTGGLPTAAPIASPSPSLPPPPLDEPGPRPYQAPDFAELPAEAKAGRWERVVAGPQPLASPTPTPFPTPTPLPGETQAYTNFSFETRNPTFAVGEALALTAADHEQGQPITWGVLEADRAAISAEGRLTASAPGAIHVHATAGSRRKYALAAAIDSALGARPLFEPPFSFGTDYEKPTWATVLRSDEDLRAALAALPVYGSPPPVAVDFTRESVVLIRLQTTSDFEGVPVVTHVSGGVVHAAVPLASDGPCICDPHTSTTAVVVPLLPPGAHVLLDRLHGQLDLAASPSTGPTPTPEPVPSPTQTPDPFNSRPPDGPPAPMMPPYPPPAMRQEGDCPPPSQMDARYQPPFSLTWYGDPYAGGSAWQPFLGVGTSFRFFAQNAAEAPGWRSGDPRVVTVAADGTVTGVRAGEALVTAQDAAGSLHALVAVVAPTAPALRFHFRVDYGIPNDQAVRGARILRDAAAWGSLWRHDLYYQLPWEPPAVDFTRYDVVALVDDRSTYAEADPVITNVSDDASVVHLVFPSVEAQGGAYHRAVYLFLTGKLAADATVRVHTLCDP